MSTWYRKPKLWQTSSAFPRVVGDAPFVSDEVVRRKNTAWKNANRMGKRPTQAEQELESILNSLNNGVLQGRFFAQWAFADKWILDFYFHENRLGIEVDGAVHQTAQQRMRDEEKEAACRAWDITLIRVSNAQVFGPRDDLVRILRSGWKKATKKIKSSVFAPQ
jgi:very-short-patch-repair endonuclease